jgi:hypothetical protein
MTVEILIRKSKVKLPPPDMMNYAEKLYNEREYFREKTAIITIRMPKSLLEELDEYCREKHISRSKAIRDAVERLINSERYC